jgi:carbonic anhydrase/acetyltransferase-like protein (isoleucine patch superfamily)
VCLWNIDQTRIANQNPMEKEQVLEDKSLLADKLVVEQSVETGKLYAFGSKTPKVHSSLFLAAGARVIGDVEIGENVSIWFNAVVRGDVERVRIKANTNIQDNAVIHVTHFSNPTEIGEGVTVGHAAVLHGCTIGDRSLIGMNAVVLDRAVIGKECLIAAGSMVRSGMRVPDGMLVAGVPAKILRPLTEEERAMVLQGAANYIKYVQHFRGEVPEIPWDLGEFAR